MRYFARRWNEPRGDAHTDWGPATYFDDDDWPVRQVEVYDNGRTLRYDSAHVEDEFGGLSEAAIDRVEFAPFAIGEEEFEHVWGLGPAD